MISWRHDWTFIRLDITKHFQYVFNHELTSQIELSTLLPIWHFLTVFALMTAALFCYFFTFLLQKGVRKRVPQNRLIIRKTHFMGGTLKNRGHILWFFTRDSWVGHTSSCPSQKSLFFRTERTDERNERTDIGSEKLADVIGASRNHCNASQSVRKLCL